MTIKAVVFDIGNVLIEWQPERFFDSVIGGQRRREMFANVDLHGMNDRVDLGQNFTDTVMATADANPDWATEIRMWHDRWIDMAAPAIDHSVRLMKALQAKGTPVFSLTNFGIQTYDIAAEVYPFLREFDRDFISGHMGVIKPDPQIFQMLEDESGLSGDALIFADDRDDNIAAAAARGWNTHLFKNPEGWAARLVEEGLLTEDEAT
ncbi:HAD family phosphatase [Sulfitobacter pseudonitzschiae]|uniref:HAD family phosphatase n=1 Tax=Pseudosulfitobacter pseudonitzschiae TaxID=1402135 RepID=A0A9Q2NXJ5_9RHOB|nr:HAD family phosphatase [Pseudosulfitobacter pseudonitzschiae]MBM2290468.1 HAD family phosphatase [Pseudosulfitobacter pseudonitzschiae]MBM2295386.1 HAD family phosphatase [Pseudosulfitobacter pseudonitzschiae]MBM2300298.1 HAD family phosphatase [Pseudosulfitobacter pseudonitzschiae]MBM2310083.1 HAD family phosphatase [Pseudosulfitobacter pseudonitzschiae]MBM2314995.1 HAD family phosphatase [Pseudosulfitobacter pseudonitzschiae]|tara:strand:+ start:3773 stop:4393 length:621 start_codon:yes stop_codon:yes gene_type:complete